MISSCFCGSVKIEINGNPEWVSYCHCLSCRKATGAPVTAYASFKNTDLEYKAGDIQYYESSPGTKWGSCSKCNSPLTYQALKYPADTHIHLITIDKHSELSPDSHVHVEESVPWFTISDKHPKYQGSSDDSSNPVE